MRKRGRPKAKNPASVYVTVRVSRDQKERLERRAKMVGVKLSEYLRTRVLAELQTEAPAAPEPIPGQTTVEEVAAAAEVEAEARFEADPVRETFVARRVRQLYARGRTKRLARVEAEAEWRNRGSA